MKRYGPKLSQECRSRRDSPENAESAATGAAGSGVTDGYQAWPSTAWSIETARVDQPGTRSPDCPTTIDGDHRLSREAPDIGERAQRIGPGPARTHDVGGTSGAPR